MSVMECFSKNATKLQQLLWLADTGEYTVEELARYFHETPTTITFHLLRHHIKTKSSPVRKTVGKYEDVLLERNCPGKNYQDYLEEQRLRIVEGH